MRQLACLLDFKPTASGSPSCGKSFFTTAVVSRFLVALLPLIAMWLFADSAQAQQASPDRIDLSQIDSNASRVSTLRRDFADAIVYGAPPQVVERLIDQRRQTDSELADQLKQIEQRLAEIPKSSVDAQERQTLAKLKRKRSLAWLTRVELSSLQADCFASGSAEAISTASQTIHLIGQAVRHLPNDSEVRAEVDRLLIEAHLQAGDGWAAQSVIAGSSANADDPASPANPPEPSILIRIDLANQSLDEASAKLRAFFGSDPASAPHSFKMDLAYFQFLILKSKIDQRYEQSIGDWLDKIETRNGWVARRRAETVLARSREASASPDRKQIDARLQLADARYYVRVGKPLPAAISFAQAAVHDNESTRSIESAISSAAILQQLSKHAAAAELLMKVAERHPNESLAPGLLLQAATLLSHVIPPERDKLQAVLRECLVSWPNTPAAAKARDWLIELALGDGEIIEAAKLATRMPDVHWSEPSSRRCQNLWMTAVVESEDASAALQAMNVILNEVSSEVTNPLMLQAKARVLVLLSDDLEKVSQSGRLIDDPFLKSFASMRHSPSGDSAPSIVNSAHDSKDFNESFLKTLKWRIQHDIEQRPKTAGSLAAFLLKEFPAKDLASMRWLIMDDRVDEALGMMRQQMPSSDDPARWIQTAAETLSLPSRFATERLRLAADLWSELAAGYPENHPREIEAQVASIRCRFQSGDRQAASAEAELILLTRPPEVAKQRSLLEAMVQ